MTRLGWLRLVVMSGEVRGLWRYLVVMVLRYALVCAIGAAAGALAWWLIR